VSTIVRWLRERVRSAKSAGTLLPAHSITYGETPSIGFSDYLGAYLKDPSCKAFVDFLADQLVGVGFYTTVDEDYPGAQEAKQVVDEFCEKVNLDGLLQIGAREIIMCGNSFWEKVEPDNLEELRILPLASVQKIRRDVYGNVEGYVQTVGYGEKTLAPKTIIHFRWNPVNGEAFGTGVLRPLLEEMRFDGETRMSFLEMKARIERMLPEIFEKYAGPDELWIFKDVADERLTEYRNMIKNKPKAGARFVYNKEADVKTVQIDPRTQFQAYLEHILGQVNMGGQSPVSCLMISPNYLTKASSEAAMHLVERKVLSGQRYIKRVVEREIFRLILEQAGHDPIKAGVRLNWGIPEKVEVRIEDILKAGELGFVRSEEVRKMLAKNGWELWEPTTSHE